MAKETQSSFSNKAANRYRDPTGELSNRTLRLSEWYLRHKILLKHLLIGALIIWSAGSVGWSFFRWGEYLFVGMEEDRRLAAELSRSVNYTRLQPIYKAEDLRVDGIRVFQSAGGVYTIAAAVQNPNPRHLAQVRYQFFFAGGETAPAETIVLPGQERPLAAFGVKSDVFPADIELKMIDIRWRRVNPHTIFDVAEFLSKRLDIGVRDFVYEPSGGDIPVPRMTFTVDNRTPYGFWQAVFLVELLQGDTPADLSIITLDQLRAGESRPVDVRLFGDSPPAGDIRLIPTMNVFDASVYLPPTQ